MSQAIHAQIAIVLVLLQSRLPRLAEFFIVVVNAEGALGGYSRLCLVIKARGEGEGELLISLVPSIARLHSPDSFQTATTSFSNT